VPWSAPFPASFERRFDIDQALISRAAAVVGSRFVDR